MIPVSYTHLKELDNIIRCLYEDRVCGRILPERYDVMASGYEQEQSELRPVSYTHLFVLTTNVDHCFQKAGFEKNRLFYTQGDYGLFQCSEPCCQETYDNKEWVDRMVTEQEDMRLSLIHIFSSFSKIDGYHLLKEQRP